jgi:hypothetical protein
VRSVADENIRAGVDCQVRRRDDEIGGQFGVARLTFVRVNGEDYPALTSANAFEQ